MTLANLRNLIEALKRNRAKIEEELNSQKSSPTAYSIGEEYGCSIVGAGYFRIFMNGHGEYRSTLVILNNQNNGTLYKPPVTIGRNGYEIDRIPISWNNDDSPNMTDVLFSGYEPIALIGPSAFREFVRNLKALDDTKPAR